MESFKLLFYRLSKKMDRLGTVATLAILAAGVFVCGYLLVGGTLHETVALHDFMIRRVTEQLEFSIKHPDSVLLERRTFFGSRYINSSECTYVVGEFRSTKLSADQVISAYKDDFVRPLFGTLPVHVEIMTSTTSMPMENAASDWADEFVQDVGVSTVEKTYYLVYVKREGGPWFGDYRCLEGESETF